MIHPIAFLGESRELEAQRFLLAAFNDWQKNWCMNEGTDVEIKIGKLSYDDFIRLNTHQHIGIQDHNQVILTHAVDAMSWGRFVFNGAIDKIPQDDVFDYLCSEARRAFFKTVEDCFRQVGRHESQSFVAVTIESYDAVEPLFSAEFTSEHASLYVVFSASLFDYAIQPSNTPQPVLTPRLKAVERTQVDLQVILKFGRLPLPEIQMLQVGDVVRSEHLLATPLEVESNQRQVARAILGKQSDHLMVKLTPTT